MVFRKNLKNIERWTAEQYWKLYLQTPSEYEGERIY